MHRRKSRTAVPLTLIGLVAWLLVSTIALAQVEQAHLRIDGMT
jgi:hypothetical protein